MAEERTRSSERIFQGRIVSLRIDRVAFPDGSLSTREIVEAHGAAGIVALDDEDNLLLVRQFRKPTEREIWEIPAGTLEPGEEPLHCARRELAEETGYHAAKWTPLPWFYTSPGFCDEIMHLFLAEGLTGGHQRLERDEFLSVRRVPLADAVRMIRDGEIVDAKTVVGVLLAARRTDPKDLRDL